MRYLSKLCDTNDENTTEMWPAGDGCRRRDGIVTVKQTGGSGFVLQAGRSRRLKSGSCGPRPPSVLNELQNKWEATIVGQDNRRSDFAGRLRMQDSLFVPFS